MSGGEDAAGRQPCDTSNCRGGDKRFGGTGTEKGADFGREAGTRRRLQDDGGSRIPQLGAGLFERGVSEDDGDVVLRGPEGGRAQDARRRRARRGSPPTVQVCLRCSRDSMANTGTEPPASGKRAAEREAERGRGVKRSKAPPAASEEVGGRFMTGRRGLTRWAISEGRTGLPRPSV